MNTSLVQFFSNGMAKTKLVMLAFLYCDAFVKNSIATLNTPLVHTLKFDNFYIFLFPFEPKTFQSAK